MIEEIKDLIVVQQKLARQALSEYSVLVDSIVVSKTTDQNRIEHTLDGILDFCFDADMVLLFKKYVVIISPSTRKQRLSI